MAKALDGVTVVEFAAHLASAYAAMLLAEQGARTIKIEPPGGEPGRGGPHFHIVNRSKRSVVLDLDCPEGIAQARQLLRLADIVVSGLTPDRQRALGLDYESVRRLNPRVLMLTMPPMGSRGPLANRAAENDLVEAHSGIAASQWSRSGNPVAQTFPAASYQAGLLGAAAAVAALVARDDGAGGQVIEASILAGAISLQTGGVMRSSKMPGLYSGPQDPLGPLPVYRLYEAGDGNYFFLACGNARFWHRLALAIERPELISDPRFEHAPWGVRGKNCAALQEILTPIFLGKPRDEWLRILRDNEIPCAPVATRQEFIDSPQIRHLGMAREVNDPVLGPTLQMGVPVLLHRTPGAIVRPAPDVDQADATLSSLIEQARAMAAPSQRAGESSARARRGPLAGTLVLDFSGYIAGALGPMFLSQFGATVLKVESLEGDPFRNVGYGFMGWNQNKRSIALDLKSPRGREIACALIKRADVLVENMRSGRTRALGIDYDTVASINPRLVYLTVTAFGSTGPEHDQPGFDPLAQALSGVMAAHGGAGRDDLREAAALSGQPEPIHPLYMTCAIGDYGAAILSALGCVLGLRARQITGLGQHCETSLLHAAMATQAGEFVFYPGRPNLENGAPELRGTSALHRAYQCQDGKWIHISISNGPDWDALRTTSGAIPPMPFSQAKLEGPYGVLARALIEHFSVYPSAMLLERLARVRVPVTFVNRQLELFTDAQAVANELVAELTHAEYGAISQVGLLAKFSATPAQLRGAAPLLGEHTGEILTEYLGYDQDKIAALRASGVVR